MSHGKQWITSVNGRRKRQVVRMQKKGKEVGQGMGRGGNEMKHIEKVGGKEYMLDKK